MFNQIENFRAAILKKKAKIEEINFVCSQPMRPGVNPGSRRRLIEKRLHWEQAVTELEREVRRLEFEEANRRFQWEDIDQELLKEKTFELARKMHDVAGKGERRIQFETARNLNSSAYLAHYLDFHEQLANEWAEQLYQAHRETWKQQNRPVLPAFIRAVRDRAIVPLFAARKSAVGGQVALRAMQTNDRPKPLAIAAWMLRMDRLADRWKRKLEAEAIVAQHAGLSSQPNEPARFESAVTPQQRVANATILNLTDAFPENETLENFEEENEKDLARREAIVKKVENPQAYKVLLIREAATYFSVQPRTIYRWLMDGKLRDGGRSGSVTTESVRQWEAKRRRKRREK